MQLVVKTTRKCDMNCTFCAANGCTADIGTLSAQEVIDEINKFKECTEVIFLGGEDLTLPPEHYREILDHTNPDIHFDFVTNLKDFYLHPTKWVNIFADPRVVVTTSFNYGDTRRWDKDTVYDEKLFRKVMTKFKKVFRYTPTFIAVLDENNWQTWRKHIELAKDLGTVCRLNGAFKLGRSTSYFPRSHMFKIWTTIIDEGLEKYEMNAQIRKNGCCPFNTDLICAGTIRVVKKEIDGSIKYYNCDDKANIGKDPHDKMKPISVEETAPKKVLKDDCYACLLFRLCNGCELNVDQIEDADAYCREMKSLEDKFIEQEWTL